VQRSLLFSVLLAGTLPWPVLAQGDSSVVIAGRVTTARGVGVDTANVFLLETLEGAITSADGRFEFSTTRRGPATLVVRREGFRNLRTPVVVAADMLRVELALIAAAQTLATVNVIAGRYTAGDERGAVLTPLEVVTTPGAHADVARALQALPGVQNVDEGTALFVRGGDYTETKTLIDGAVLFTAFTYDSPNATFIGTVDPFLLDGIQFSSGGFGAKHGDAMSAIASLRTQGRATSTSATLGAGLAALSASAGTAITSKLGVRAAGNLFDTDVLFRVNGSTASYSPPPFGHDLSGSVVWDYRLTGQVKVFAIDQRLALGVKINEPSYSGAYEFSMDGMLAVANWKDIAGPVLMTARASRSTMDREQDYGAFRLLTGIDLRGGAADAEWGARDNLTLRGGTELEETRSSFNGSVPSEGDDRSPGARTVTVGSTGSGDRFALFGEAEWRPLSRTRTILGVRSDHSSLTGQRTVDPRTSLAVELRPGMTVTAAWGVYHQLPDPLFFDATLGNPAVRTMRATHTIIGAQLGSGAVLARAELYAKRYRDLAQMTRDYDVVVGGTGRSRGFDLFLKGPVIPGVSGRISYSILSARRTDPHTGIIVPAPFDVTHTLTAIAEGSFGSGGKLGIAQRGATGRPYTPIVSATFDAARGVWTPAYGAPMSARLPGFTRTDLSASYFKSFAGMQAVVYAALTNVFDRSNVYAYRYSPDYQQQFEVRSLFNRAFYFGASLIFP